MTGVIRKATLLAVLGLVVASAAMAGVPSPSNCTIPPYVNVVACALGTDNYPPTVWAVPATRYQSTITVRDLGNYPLSGIVVSLLFCSDVDIYSVIPGGVVAGQLYTHTAVTGADGKATVTITGAGYNKGGIAYGTNGTACAGWYANGAFMGASNVSIYDGEGVAVGGHPGVEPFDLSALLGDIIRCPADGYKPRSDYNNSFNCEPFDLTYWIQYRTGAPPYVSPCVSGF